MAKKQAAPGLITTVLLLAVGVLWWTITGTGAVASSGIGQPERSAGMSSMLDFAREGLEESYQVSAQWTGSIDREQANRLMEQLEAVYALGILHQDNNHLSGEFAGAAGGSFAGSISLMEEGSGRVQAFLQLEAEAADEAQLSAARDLLDSWLGAHEEPGSWSVKLTGQWRDSLDSEAEGLQKHMADAVQLQVELLAERVLGAGQAGIYQEGNMVNATYYSETLPFLLPGGHTTRLQTALHQDTETGQWRISVGAPMLSGEF